LIIESPVFKSFVVFRRFFLFKSFLSSCVELRFKPLEVLVCCSIIDFSLVSKLLTIVAVDGVKTEFFGDNVLKGDKDSLNGD
jgi:hypothetical protein